MARRVIKSNDTLVNSIKEDIIINFPKYKTLSNMLLDYELDNILTKREVNEIIDFYYVQESINRRGKRYIRKFTRLFKRYMDKWYSMDDIRDIIDYIRSYGFVETELKGTTFDVHVIPRTIMLKTVIKGIPIYIVMTLYVERNEKYRITLSVVDKVF